MILESRVTSILPPETSTTVRRWRRLDFDWTTAARAAAPAPRQSLFLLQKQEDGAGDFLVVHGDDLVDVAGDQGQGEIAGAADRDTVGDGGLGGDGDRRSSLAGAQHGGKIFRFDTDHANLGVGFLERAGDAADEAAAPMGTTTASMSGTCSSNSRAMVPWPLMTSHRRRDG